MMENALCIDTNQTQTIDRAYPENGGEPFRAPEHGVARLQMEITLAVPGDGGRYAIDIGSISVSPYP